MDRRAVRRLPGGGDLDARERIGYRWIDPDPGLVQRRGRFQASVRAGSGRAAVQPRPVLSLRAAGPHGRRCRAVRKHAGRAAIRRTSCRCGPSSRFPRRWTASRGCGSVSPAPGRLRAGSRGRSTTPSTPGGADRRRAHVEQFELAITEAMIKPPRRCTSPPSSATGSRMRPSPRRPGDGLCGRVRALDQGACRPDPDDRGDGDRSRDLGLIWPPPSSASTSSSPTIGTGAGCGDDYVGHGLEVGGRQLSSTSSR